MTTTTSRTQISGYSIALAATAGAVALRSILDPILGDTLPLVTLFGAVALAVWSGGYGPALMATVLGYFACHYLFVIPRGQFAFDLRVVVGMFAYLATCVIIIGFGEATRVSQRRFDELARRQEGTTPPTSGFIERVRQTHHLRDFAVAGFLLLMAMLVVSGAIGVQNIRRLSENARQLAHTHDVVASLDGLLSSLKDAETGQRGYLLTGDPKYLQPHESARNNIQAALSRLDTLTADSPEQRSRLETVKARAAARLDELTQTIDLAKNGNRDQAISIVRTNRGKDMMDDLRARTATMRTMEEDALHRQNVEASRSFETAVASLAVTSIAGLIFVAVVFQLNQRHAIARQRSAEAIDAQRELLRVTLGSIGDAVISTDAEGRITYLNAVAETLTGWTTAEASARPLDDVFRILNQQTREPVDNPVDKVLREGVVVGLGNHTVLVRKDGVELPIDDSAAPIRSEDGRISGCVLIFRDVSERRRLETENAERLVAARFLASIIESSNDAIVSKSLEGVIQSWNAAAERLFGYSAAEAIGRHISLIIPADRSTEEDQIIGRIRAGERVDHFETVRVKRDGQPVHVSLTISPIRDEAGRVVGASKIARDIMERKESEERIYALLNDLKRADRSKDEFLAMLAHELRAPLAPLRNMVEVLKRAEGQSSVVTEARTTMDRQLGHLSRLVDDLIDVSRITRGMIALHIQPVELASIVHHAVEASRPLVESARHELSITLPPEPIYLEADPTRLAQVLSNLLNNAAKYTEPGGHIRLNVEREGNDVLVSVTDTGIGIPADKLETVFDMFMQVDGSLDRSQGGLGLGLTLAKRLVEMHEGTITAFSEGAGRGSRFIVRLPGLDHAPEPASMVPAAVESPPRRFLVVDDNRDAATSLVMLLGMTGNETRAAYDGIAAIEVAEQFRPDVILLDIGLPKMSGLDACRRIREQPWGLNMVIIALTGWGQENDRRKSTDAGFDYHMVKPVDYEALMKMLESRT